MVTALQLGAFCSAEGVPVEGSRQLTHDDLAVSLESAIDNVNQLSDEGFDNGEHSRYSKPNLSNWPAGLCSSINLQRCVVLRYVVLQCISTCAL